MIERISLNEALYKNKINYTKSRCFLISPLRMSVIAESYVFKKTDKLQVIPS